MRLAVLILMAVALAACQTAAPTAPAASSDQAHALYTRLTEAVKTCWFTGGTTFATYIYTPEINANAPRILIVPKKDPHGRPVLVIAPTGAASADLYGPLLQEPEGARIRSDVDRWLKGANACAAAA